MKKLTLKELKSIDKLQTAFLNLPDTLKLYVIDNVVVVCKKGVSSHEIDETAGYVSDSGAMLTDLHDARNNGLE